MAVTRDSDDPLPAPAPNVSARGIGRWAWSTAARTWSLETKRPGVCMKDEEGAGSTGAKKAGDRRHLTCSRQKQRLLKGG